MAKPVFARALGALLLASAGLAPTVAQAQSMPLVYLNQGSKWTPAQRSQFYTQDQGSQMIPLAWMRALKLPDGTPFLADGLTRYGYLPNPDSASGLPIGFTDAGPDGNEMVGMNCSACHTRDINVSGTLYRVDGGPAIVDFQALLIDLVDAVGRVAKPGPDFDAFANTVLGPDASDEDKLNLAGQLAIWYSRENTLRNGAYAQPGLWGLGRLDAVSMIFDRLTGLDIGPPEKNYLIPENIQPADAPVRYPFLWNAWIQDYTQWPGFAPNGDSLLGLVRNLGEVYGVFGTFHPERDRRKLFGVNFMANNSANFAGLDKLEELITKIGAPKWPWRIDTALAAQGQAVWNKPSLGNQSCADCHDQKKGQFRSLFHSTWATPIINVNTDTREWAVIGRVSQSGSLEGGKIPIVGRPIGKVEPSISLLSFSVGGSIAQYYLPSWMTGLGGKLGGSGFGVPKTLAEAMTAIPTPQKGETLKATAPSGEKVTNAYESRVMYGIWAAAPYLHNGSVATLADLLKPSSQRPVRFAVGNVYDLATIGLATSQPGNYWRETTGCEDLNSGNSRCGHEYGTEFSDAEKKALLEFMKGL